MDSIKSAAAAVGRFMKNLWAKGWWGKLGAILIVLFACGLAQQGLIGVGLMKPPPTPVPTATTDTAAVAAKLTAGAADKGTTEANDAGTAAAHKAERDAASAERDATIAADATKEASGAGVTMANFNKIESGMTYEQVVELLGEEGTVLSQSDVAGFHTVMYTWNGEGGFGANMNAMFQNGKLVNKAQLGLK